ncbi:MAG: M28 family peptidase [Clostridiales bacterium]|nr:M28 family peptidase [Clostridiales bacterium]
MMKQTKKLFSVVLIVGMLFSLGTATYAADYDLDLSACTLQASMEYLVNHIGQRLAGTPNEALAAKYAKDVFEEIGYTDVIWKDDISRGAVSIGRVVFDGSGDILGNALPNSAAFPKVEGQLVDLGTYPDLSIPEGVSGDIIAVVRFNSAPNANNLNPVLAALQEDNDIEIVGLLQANATTFSVASVTGTPDVPCITTTGYFLERALAKADTFLCLERHTSALTNAVVATKPAPGGDPDLIIVFSSHMDSVLAAAGASDNASAVAANLELARRLFDVDLGNIEVRFAVVGSEENGGMAGSVWVANQIIGEGKASISINLNMDMICSPSSASASGANPLNAVSMDINTAQFNATGFNLPSYLVTDEAKDIDWADGIDNVRIYRYGSSDHVSFATRGIEAGSMIIVTDSADDIEYQDHNSRDNLEENYSYERLLMCTNLMENAVLKAARQEVSKKAKFYVDEFAGTVTLHNAEQLFKTYDTVSGAFVSAEGSLPFTFTADEAILDLADPSAYAINNVIAKGTGTADNLNAARNEQYSTFTAGIAVEMVTLDEVWAEASVAKLKGNQNELSISVFGLFSDGLIQEVAADTFTVNNNAASSYEIERYMVFVDTKGNDQICNCYVIADADPIPEPDPGDPDLPEISIEAYVEKKNGNTNLLTITIYFEYPDGAVAAIIESFSVGNNASGVFEVGDYSVFVEIKGNDQIRSCFFVE